MISRTLVCKSWLIEEEVIKK